MFPRYDRPHMKGAFKSQKQTGNGRDATYQSDATMCHHIRLFISRATISAPFSRRSSRLGCESRRCMFMVFAIRMPNMLRVPKLPLTPSIWVHKCARLTIVCSASSEGGTGGSVASETARRAQSSARAICE